MITREGRAPIDQLLQDFVPWLSAGEVIRTYLHSFDDLRQTGLTSGLPVAAEAMTRRRLNELMTERGCR